MSVAESLNFILPTIAHILYFIQHIVNFMTKSLAAFLHLKIRLWKMKFMDYKLILFYDA